MWEKGPFSENARSRICAFLCVTCTDMIRGVFSGLQSINIAGVNVG